MKPGGRNDDTRQLTIPSKCRLEHVLIGKTCFGRRAQRIVGVGTVEDGLSAQANRVRCLHSIVAERRQLGRSRRTPQTKCSCCGSCRVSPAISSAQAHPPPGAASFAGAAPSSTEFRLGTLDATTLIDERYRRIFLQMSAKTGQRVPGCPRRGAVAVRPWARAVAPAPIAMNAPGRPALGGGAWRDMRVIPRDGRRRARWRPRGAAVSSGRIGDSAPRSDPRAGWCSGHGRGCASDGASGGGGRGARKNVRPTRAPAPDPTNTGPPAAPYTDSTMKLWACWG